MSASVRIGKASALSSDTTTRYTRPPRADVGVRSEVGLRRWEEAIVYDCGRRGSRSLMSARVWEGDEFMKAGTISLGLWHIEPGHRREVCQWHDADHKP